MLGWNWILNWYLRGGVSESRMSRGKGLLEAVLHSVPIGIPMYVAESFCWDSIFVEKMLLLAENTCSKLSLMAKLACTMSIASGLAPIAQDCSCNQCTKYRKGGGTLEWIIWWNWAPGLRWMKVFTMSIDTLIVMKTNYAMWSDSHIYWHMAHVQQCGCSFNGLYVALQHHDYSEHGIYEML